MTTIEDYVARRVELKEQIERYEQEVQLIDERLREAFDFGNNDAGEWTVQVQHNRRLNTAAIEAAFPVAQFPHLYRPAVDTAAVKENLAPVVLDQYYSEGTAKILVK